MNPAALEYLKNRIVVTDCKQVGEITTTCKLTFDNEQSVYGTSVIDASEFNKEKADAAAYEDALAVLAPGVEFIMNKRS